jgi:hypothetical protein
MDGGGVADEAAPPHTHPWARLERSLSCRIGEASFRGASRVASFRGASRVASFRGASRVAVFYPLTG